jgi:tRNA/tmRNA/rRNA uracil-C5-methylase (TrmA/RlmC/RlmD family)
MKINDRYTVKIHGYCAEGAGVARLDNGCVVFVEGAARDDVCVIVITKVLSRVCYAVIEKLIEASKHRIQADCPVFPECGGCDYRHISYEEELYAKRKRVNDALQRIGGVDIQAEDILTTGKINGYRNNIQLKSDGKKIGFYGKKSHDVIEISKCLLAGEDVNVNSPQTRTKSETIGDLTFHISHESFFQVNSEAALLLYSKAREYAALTPHEFLLDLYCGTGTITLFLGRDAKKALGVEANAFAVDNARKNAAINNIHNVEFLCEDVNGLDAKGLNPGCLVVNPPRKGLSDGALRVILKSAPSRIVYISCNPATLARDIRLLGGYRVSRVCAVDMFPRTRHVECVVKLL